MVDSLHHVPPPATLSALSRAELEALLVELYGEVATLKQTIGELREENARLKGLKGRPNIRPSGMEKGTTPPTSRKQGRQAGRGKVTPRVTVEQQVIRAEIPPGSIFQGHEPFLVQDLVISAKATRYLRERWITPDGRTILAPLPAGIEGHFGPELRRFVLVQYHQGQSTMPRLLALLRSVGVSISKRQLVRLLNENHEAFIAEAQDVLRAGLETSPWVSVDDTGARHAGKNGFCTQIGNEWFTWFRTRSAKSRLNFLDHRIKSGGMPAACRPHRLRAQRRGIRLHARAGIVRHTDRPAGRAIGDDLRRSGGDRDRERAVVHRAGNTDA